MRSLFCKKQFIYVGLALVSIGLAFATHVSAHEEDTAVNEHINKTAQNTSGHDHTLPERAQNRVTNLARNMESKMVAAIDRLLQIVGRAESRVEKLDAEGVDIDLADEMLGHAKDELNQAQTILATIDEDVEDAVTSDDPQKAFRNIKNLFLETANSIRDTHTHLITTVSLLKEAVREAEFGPGVSEAVSQEGQGQMEAEEEQE